MSHPTAYATEWWKHARDESLERKTAKAQANAIAQPGDTFLIVTEGTVTEPTYFKLLLKELSLTQVTVRVLPGWASDPKHVIDTARKEADELKRRAKKDLRAHGEPSQFDHVWAVIDCDVATRKRKWAGVKDYAASKKVQLATSMPCFEFWLLLHLKYTTRADLPDGDAAKQAFKKALGQDYCTTSEVCHQALQQIISKWPHAVKNAQKVKQHHTAAKTKEPANPSTSVNLLVSALDQSRRPRARLNS
jgi:hypothetical protein